VALTAVEIYKHLPKTNCGECGVATCLAFAMKLAQKQASLEQCPYVSEEAKAALSGAAAPPMATITIGRGEHEVQIGGETVLFRHEETFHHPCALAVTVDTSLAEEDMAARIEKIEAARYDRVGMILGVDMVALRDAGDGRLAVGARVALQHSSRPLVLMSSDPAAMKAALEVCGEGRPLLCGATADNLEDMLALAKDWDCPLVIRGRSLEELATLSQKATQAGWNKLVLASPASGIGPVVEEQTIIRRAALNKKFKPFGFPTLVVCTASDPTRQMLEACTAIVKYAGVVVLDLLEDEYLLPLVTARLNIYSDPQKPIQVEPGIHAVGEPTERSPLLVTTNFSLTYYLVEGDVMTSRVPAHILAVDTKGTSVLTAWAAGDFTAESIADALTKFNAAEKVAHRTLILPGGVAVLKGKLEELSGWEVIVGPRESSGIPHFFRERGISSS
jgi:acetyl-CoA decarbonylase/synthase complex subunit gamma